MSKTNCSRREFLTTAPAAALAATAVPEPEPEAEEEEEDQFPHATGWSGCNAREALPEELHMLRCLVAARRACRKVLKKHGPGCDALACCSICEDTKAALYAVNTSASLIDSVLLGTLEINLYGRDD